ncbi:MAG: hypothetical protein SGPRY_009635 [Prymnesium sp.]
MSARPTLPRFDFSLNLDLISETSASEVSTKTPKEKDVKRLARCGKCNNCKSVDCGSCYNCADKPKFGGPGIKKQACINRKCLLMVPRDEEGEKMARKRAKQRSGPVGISNSKPSSLPTGFGTQSFNTSISPPSSPDVDLGDDLASLGSDRSSPLTLGDRSSFPYSRPGIHSTRLDPVEAGTTGLTPAQTGLTPYFSAGVSSAADEVSTLLAFQRIIPFAYPLDVCPSLLSTASCPLRGRPFAAYPAARYLLRISTCLGREDKCEPAPTRLDLE